MYLTEFFIINKISFYAIYTHTKCIMSVCTHLRISKGQEDVRCRLHHSYLYSSETGLSLNWNYWESNKPVQFSYLHPSLDLSQWRLLAYVQSWLAFLKFWVYKIPPQSCELPILFYFRMQFLMGMLPFTCYPIFWEQFEFFFCLDFLR